MSLNKINITVAGATGYVGLDLIKILSSASFLNKHVTSILSCIYSALIIFTDSDNCLRRFTVLDKLVICSLFKLFNFKSIC